MIEENSAPRSIVGRAAIRRQREEAGDSWAQTKFVGGLILLAGLISLVLTSSHVRSADDMLMGHGSFTASLQHGPGISAGDCSQAGMGR